MGRRSVAIERREQIVWGLYECLAQSDFAQVTVKDIAEKAGVAPGIVHHYFNSKGEIYGELSVSMRDQYEKSLDAHLTTQPESASRGQATLDFIVDEFILDRSLNRVFYNLVLKSLEQPAVREPLQALLERYRDRLHDEFEMVPGEVIVAQIEGLALQNLVDPERFSRSDFLAILATFLQPDKEVS